MKIVLLKDVEKLGESGSVVEVAAGYARNCLLPHKQALLATERNIETAEREKRLRRERDNKLQAGAETLAEKIQALSCTIAKQVGENDRLFGSVTAIDIAKSLKDEGIEVDKKAILLKEPLKALGIYDIPIKLHPEISTSLKVWVVKE